MMTSIDRAAFTDCQDLLVQNKSKKAKSIAKQLNNADKNAEATCKEAEVDTGKSEAEIRKHTEKIEAEAEKGRAGSHGMAALRAASEKQAKNVHKAVDAGPKKAEISSGHREDTQNSTGAVSSCSAGKVGETLAPVRSGPCFCRCPGATIHLQFEAKFCRVRRPESLTWLNAWMDG